MYVRTYVCIYIYILIDTFLLINIFSVFVLVVDGVEGFLLSRGGARVSQL